MLCSCCNKLVKTNYIRILPVRGPCIPQYVADEIVISNPCASSLLIDDLNHEHIDDIFGEFSMSAVKAEKQRFSIVEKKDSNAVENFRF